MSRLTVREKLKRRLVELGWMREHQEIIQSYPGYLQREAWAWVWSVPVAEIGSCCTMRECVSAKHLKLGTHALRGEIWPDDE